ncbi:MAG: AAA family ATPase [Vicinamibacterales bacterium]
MLATLTLEQFAAFADSQLAFGPGVNVLVGANGTGKSHAMKVAYGAMRTAAEANRSPLALDQQLEERLAHLFLPDDLNVGRVVRRRAGGRSAVGGGNNRASVNVRHSEGQVSFTLHTKGTHLRNAVSSASPAHPVLFLPPREVLSLGPGFVQLAEEYRIPFDASYADATRALTRPPSRRKTSAMAELEERLADVLGAQVIEDNSRFYVKLSAGARLEAPLMGEGLRKVASLIRLIQNGSITRGSTLFWDEPEANLNPILIRTIADVVLGLAQAGVQVILATHDFFLASRLSMRLGAGKAADVRFIGLTAPETADGAVLETADGVAVAEGANLEDLPSALLVEALVQHADDEQRADLGRVFS